jgi:hypothetical protein
MYLSTLTDAQRERLTALSWWEERSFPNGSAYRSQQLRTGDHGDVDIAIEYGSGYYCTFAHEPGVTRIVRFDQTSVGPGAEFGMYFWTRDLALTALLPA